MDAGIVLYFLSSFAGLIMIVGGIWLIYKEKIYIDAESKQAIEIKTPLGGFKNNYPALTLFALGFFPLIYPIYRLGDIQDGRVRVATVRLSGPVKVSAYPVAIYAAAEDYFVERDGSFTVDVPIFGERDKEYKVLLVVNNQVLDTQRVRVRPDSNELSVQFMLPVIEQSEYQPELHEVSADFEVPRP
jgi:hypothetical protein